MTAPPLRVDRAARNEKTRRIRLGFPGRGRGYSAAGFFGSFFAACFTDVRRVLHVQHRGQLSFRSDISYISTSADASGDVDAPLPAAG